ncbi:hypothetical protein BC30090_p404 (plasmid) [Bacillus cereus]|uniref:ParM/StbA family protein n=2 Tax=Bacillaceae TaxID=186817 RepID=UPI0013D6D751|nr:ParM/StbA family protein [Bacillus mobilis]NEL01371.1 ParM/StbA family protein [Bacillus mobilis]BCD26931.1 hypothetical protein BC30090_p404 [Bacillus cereus]
MKKVVLAVGFESANGFVKTASDVHQEAYLNTIREITDPTTEKDLIAKAYGKTVFKVGEKYFQISALESSKSSSGENIRRYKTLEYKIESLIAIFKNIQKLDVTDAVINVHAATGVPANHFNIKSVQTDLDSNLVGKHTVNDIEFEVLSVASTLQPLAAFAKRIFNADGSPDNAKINHYMKDEYKVLIIDVGFGSTDYAEIVAGSLKKTYKTLGMREVYENILNRAYAEEEMLRTFALNEFFIESESRKGNSITKGQYKVDITDIKKEEFKKKVGNVANETGQNGLQYDTYDEVLFVGGGVEALKEELDKQFGKDPRVIIAEESQFENAKGYLIKAKSNILKEGVAS